MDAAAGQDVEELLSLVGDAQGLLGLGEFRHGLLEALGRVVPADWISLNDIGPEPESTVVVIEPPFPPEDHELFAGLAHQNPLIERFARTGDGRAYRFSDVVSADELHALELYRRFYGPIGLEHQIAFTLPHPPARLLGVALSRRDRDFTDRERDLLDRARPFLIQAYRAAVEYSRLEDDLARRRRASDPTAPDGLLDVALAGRGLTPRESQVVRWIAVGRSSAAAAEWLGISPRTAEKHLERAYAKLEVEGRSQAAAVAWSLIEN
jgi:DNA-binding CsgD family transcriptional regulator